ncbi:MAG: polysaccharide deacetylase family protein [Acidobacteriota bacterium]
MSASKSSAGITAPGIPTATARTPRPWRWTPLLQLSMASHLAAGAAALCGGQARSWALRILAADHLVLSGAGCLPHSGLLGPVTTRMPPRPDAGSLGLDMALSFDDGPDPDVTPRIAELLEERGLRASFFVIGERVRRHPEVAERLHAAGHRLENHTDTHPSDFAFSFLPRLGREIGGCQRTVSTVTGRAPAYFRAPAGMRNPLLEGALARHGLHLVSWTRRGYDTADGDGERVLRRLLNGLGSGDIVLLHDGRAARTPEGGAVSLEVLPRLLDAIEAAGLRAGPLPEPETIGLESSDAARPEPRRGS